MLSTFKKGSYRRHVAVLASGTAMGQALPIAMSPILTRLYAPEEFGILAIYGSISAILVTLSTAQYELAITLPKADRDAASLVSLATWLCGLFSLVLLMIVGLLNEPFARLLGHPEMANWFYLLPLTVFAAGLFKTYTFWANRHSAYGMIARHTLQLSAVTVGSSTLLGVFKVAGGQIIGSVIGRCIATISLVFLIHRKDREALAGATREELRAIAKRYSAHPIFFLPSKLISDFALQIPVFMISSLFLISTVGFFSIAYRLVTLPTSLIANAIGDVYRQRISHAYNETGEFRAIYKRTLFMTCAASIIPFSALFLIAPTLFGFVFGDTWSVAGDYARILALSTFFSFITTPLNKGAIVVEAKRYHLLWNVIRFLSYSGLWLVAVSQELSIEQVLWSFVSMNVCLYLLDAFYQYRLSGVKR